VLEKQDIYFFEDVLGILGENEQIKLGNEIVRMKNPAVIETALYGWGANTHGQLGVYKLNSVQMPKQIDLPESLDIQAQLSHEKGKYNTEKVLQELDYPLRVICGKRSTALVSNKGNLWLCGNYKAEKVGKGKGDVDPEQKDPELAKMLTQPESSEMEYLKSHYEKKGGKKRLEKHKA